MRFSLAILAACHFAVISMTASAHELRPAYLQIQECADNTYDVTWKVPARGETQRLGLSLLFADDVETIADPVTGFAGDAHVQRMTVRRRGGLSGTTLTIVGLDQTYTDVLLRWQRLDGTESVRRLTADNPTCVFEADPGIGSIAWTYFVLGVEHILLGIDHLLFVLALLLIVADWKKLVATVTAFTVAHSITLALATLGVVRVPGPPVEAIIALSIVFVAAEIIRGSQGKPGLAARAPWLVAFSFGLLHGFGFAGALSEVGLPQTSIPLALLTFNLGVEAGQLIFVAVVIAAYSLLHRRKSESPVVWPRTLAAYAIGGVAAFWFIERTASFWA